MPPYSQPSCLPIYVELYARIAIRSLFTLHHHGYVMPVARHKGVSLAESYLTINTSQLYCYRIIWKSYLLGRLVAEVDAKSWSKSQLRKLGFLWTNQHLYRPIPLSISKVAQ